MQQDQFVLRFVNGYWMALCLETFRHMEVFALEKDGIEKMKKVNAKA